MAIRDQIREIESVEQLFELLSVPYESSVIAVHRMRVLRRFGRELETLERGGDSTTSDSEFKLRCAAILRGIHEDCARGMREPEPVFRGLEQPLVQLRRPLPHRRDPT